MSEQCAREFLTGLRRWVSESGATGDNFVMRLSCGDVAADLDLPQANAKQLVEDFERGLALYQARKLARGQPIAKVEKVTRDAANEIQRIETEFVY